MTSPVIASIVDPHGAAVADGRARGEPAAIARAVVGQLASGGLP
jgi:hypothetical protein